MGRYAADDAGLRRLTDRFERMLGRLGRLARGPAAQVAHGPLPGAFSSRRSAAIGLEPEPSRPFGPDDEPSQLDLGRLGPTFARNPAWAAIAGELRATRATAYLESEFVCVVDLSRSMLAGCRLVDDPGTGHAPPEKLAGLYFAAASFLALAESSRFVLRAIYARGGGVAEDRSRTPRQFHVRALAAMSDGLVAGFRSALVDPRAAEPFSLAAGLSAACAVRTRGVVFVISDFLDPLRPDEMGPGEASFEVPLLQLLARHRVILADVASPFDVRFPEPGPLDIEARRAPRCEGARHLERGVQPRALSRRAIRDWNARRGADRERVRGLVESGGGRWERFWGLSFAGCLARAMTCLR